MEIFISVFISRGFHLKIDLGVSKDELKIKKNYMEMPGIEPGASHMQSERSTTELHPHVNSRRFIIVQINVD